MSIGCAEPERSTGGNPRCPVRPGRMGEALPLRAETEGDARYAPRN